MQRAGGHLDGRGGPACSIIEAAGIGRRDGRNRSGVGKHMREVADGVHLLQRADVNAYIVVNESLRFVVTSPGETVD